ncbi:MAG: malonyl-CoA decarboxylase [Gammaproteobacteria bacterium]|nr:malonyl-CoA decarboxylase [Gammaproteobacteria bacterium]NIN37237.1 malonyl-CoA decarboxylase [Gammaproteobacteria bacterium]NIO26095.1 malonyl-CoA decarboxylase [Gammaproteobacteria bacterium]NIO66708.1 malonyl-CoA decarboxylase [Gammaproteobacteria bacterium]NIP46385.1 malonyl-CoA decarboxylase [Gammaproteobacteria bacterium]
MNDHAPGILDRTLRRFRRAWRLGGMGHGPLKEGVEPDLPDADAERVRRQIDACLEARGGQVSARARAAELGETYLVLDAAGRRRFLEILAREYDVDTAAVDAAILARQEAEDEAERRRAESYLREALVPPRVKLLAQFNELSQGVKFLVDVRAELMMFASEDIRLQALDADIHALLASWFDIGFLDLERITWETPASLLEKLIEYEAVHAIRSWDDLKNRLGDDRRCYAYFHPRMPEEPLIFVQVALVKGISGSIQGLLDENAPPGDPEEADTAIFYSISNCHLGLAGVNFGNFLIKRVVDDLARSLPNLKTFATLSPIPGFCEWVREHGNGDQMKLFDDSEFQSLEALTGTADPIAAIDALLEQSDWMKQPDVVSVLEPILMRLCARYLVQSRDGQRARNRVAHFHLSNGALIERINWLADTSSRGLAESAGLMVNYRYKLEDIEKNHEAYTGKGEVIAGAAVKKLL